MLRNFCGALTVLAVGACSTIGLGPKEEAPVPQTAASVEMSGFERAMDTVSRLEAAANEQAAIDRLTQLLGDPDLGGDQLAEVHLKRAKLRAGPGNDVEGAISDYEELLANYPDSGAVPAAEDGLAQAAEERSELVAALEDKGLSPLQKFKLLFRLGRHQEASDIMFASEITPDNEYLLDMYQIGYLCEGEGLAGRSYAVEEPDGTRHSVQFCDTPQ